MSHRAVLGLRPHGAFLVAAASLLLACGGEGGGTAPTTLPSTVDDSLNELGVSTVPTPRIGNDGVALPEDHSPFGQRLKIAINGAGETHIGAPLELVVGGFELQGSMDPFAVLDNLELPATGLQIAPSPIFTLDPGEAPWAREDDTFEKAPPVTLRDAAGGDLDGDGYDELVVAYASGGQVFLRIANLADLTVADETLPVAAGVDVLPVGDVRVRAADLDQDGRAEIVLALSQVGAGGRSTSTGLLVLDWTPGSLVERFSRTFQSTLGATPQSRAVDVSAVLEPGNVDYDAAAEIVLVLNEFEGTGPFPSRATTRFLVLDDAAHGLAELLADTLVVEAGSSSYPAQVADVAIGDIDGDQVNEIVFGGLAGLTTSVTCNNGPVGPDSLRYLLLSYEFTGQGIHRTRTASSSDADSGSLYPGYCNQHDAYTWAIRFLDVNILDFDDDRVADIQANQFVFSGIPEQGWVWGQRAAFTLPEQVLFPDEDSDLVFDRSTARIIVNDVDGNGRQDLLSYRGGANGIRVHAWRQPLSPSGDASGPPELFTLAFIGVKTTSPDGGTLVGSRLNPMLVALDADGLNEGDVQTLQYVGHRLEFTEPLVLAAIAAPPCLFGKGQNTDACTSSWGTARVSGTEAEREIKVKAGFTVGYEWEAQSGGGIGVVGTVKLMGFAAKLELSEELAFTRSESYEVSRSVSFETGPMEDSVVFASIPYDFYTYEVIARTYVTTADPGDVRELQRLGLPRTPIIRMAEVGYYNAHTTATAVKIDDAVLQHAVGRLDSYPTPGQRDQILSVRRTQLDAIRIECPGCWQVDPDAPLGSGNIPRRQFDPREALEGLSSDTVGVGQGSGATQVAIDFGRSSSFGSSLEKSAELDVEFNFGGVVAGFAVGGGVSHSTQISRGERTTYVGTVGSIDAANFAAQQYRFGMFTYLQGDPASGQEFEVVNYWVE
jgi:hypothetical protein